MDEYPRVLPESAEQAEHADFADESQVEDASAEFVGRWNRLVSTTNWEKGRIISQWRERLVQAGAPLAACSDEAWSRRVGGVSPQHVGRLRRVWQRFAAVCEQYSGLFWSHFQAALDWDDAEMWLEGAVQSGWSVARMRAERWQAMGGLPEQAPREEDVAAAEMDEDFTPAEGAIPEALHESLREVHDVERDGAGPGAQADSQAAAVAAPWDDAADPAAPAAAEPVRPFESLPPLPHDLADALEAFKLAILHHKLSGWKDVSCRDVLAVLDALKQLAAAPA